jgi:hypothetical protein
LDLGPWKQHRLGRLDREQQTPPPLDLLDPLDPSAPLDLLDLEPWKQRQLGRLGPLDREHLWARLHLLDLESLKLHQLGLSDPPDREPWRQDPVSLSGLTHLLALLRPVVLGVLVIRHTQWGRHCHGMTRLTLADDSWIRFPCCRKILPWPALVVRRIRQILDSIAGSAATSEP